MKKIIFILMSLLLISSVSALSVGKVRYFDDVFLVNVYNDEAKDLEDLNIRVMVMDDLNVYRAKAFDLDKREQKGIYVMIEEPVAETGETLIRLTVRNDDTHRIKYLII